MTERVPKAKSIDKKLTPAEAEKAVRLNILTLDEYDAHLEEIGYRARDRKIKVQLLQKELHLKAPKEKADEEEDPESFNFERDAQRISEAIRG